MLVLMFFNSLVDAIFVIDVSLFESFIDVKLWLPALACNKVGEQHRVSFILDPFVGPP